MNNQKEVWLPIKDYENLLQVSNLGRVKRKSSFIKYKNGNTCFHKERILKQENLKGYNRVSLSNKNKVKRFFVHRLVAIMFLKNKELKKCVNHKNGLKNDNKLENLEWCTHSENEIHSYKTLKKNNSQKKLSEKNVYFILNNYKKGKNGNIKELSLRFKVDVKTIYNLINRKYYV